MGVSNSIRIGFAVCLCATTMAVAAKRKPAATVSPWQQAEQMRLSLEAEPAQERTRSEYTRVMEAYRAVYYSNPADLHAPAAVFAVGELLAQQGRGQSDNRISQKAMGQFEFLRKQYPGSSLRVTALLAEGIIAQNDLRDSALAKDRYNELLKRYPRSAEANDARTGLAQLKSGVRPQEARANSISTPAANSVPTAVGAGLPVSPTQGGQLVATSVEQPAAPKKRNGMAVVSSIRHWSTPDYTRVAIDLGDEVQYEAARVPHPERIFFDLHGTRLAQELVGKNFNVTDDGFLKRIRAAQFSNDVTRVVLDVNDVTEYSAFLLPNPARLIIDIHGSQKDQPKLPRQNVLANTSPDINQEKSAPPVDQMAGNSVPAPPVEKLVAPVANVPSTVATVPSGSANRTSSSHEVANLGQQPGKVKATAAPTSEPIAASVKPVIETDEASLPAPPGDKKNRKGQKKNAVLDEPVGRMAVPTAAGETSLVRALGLKIGRIVIDAGHGGHDSGTLGVDGLMEKDVVLDVALRLGKQLHERLGAEIVYTRSDDTFIPLETRTAIANKAQADLFLSIHANSSSDASARGVETYYLNFTSQADALEVAARENAVSNQSISQLSDLVKKIALKDKIEESREFAFDVEQSLYGGLQKGNDGLKNRGIKKAPFVVLIGANMPSILTEISFVTNPRDANQLRQADYRQRIADSIFKGVARYANGLSGMRFAQGSGGSSSGKSSGN